MTTKRLSRPSNGEFPGDGCIFVSTVDEQPEDDGLGRRLEDVHVRVCSFFIDSQFLYRGGSIGLCAREVKFHFSWDEAIR